MIIVTSIVTHLLTREEKNVPELSLQICPSSIPEGCHFSTMSRYKDSLLFDRLPKSSLNRVFEILNLKLPDEPYEDDGLWCANISLDKEVVSSFGLDGSQASYKVLCKYLRLLIKLEKSVSGLILPPLETREIYETYCRSNIYYIPDVTTCDVKEPWTFSAKYKNFEFFGFDEKSKKWAANVVRIKIILFIVKEHYFLELDKKREKLREIEYKHACQTNVSPIDNAAGERRNTNSKPNQIPAVKVVATTSSERSYSGPGKDRSSSRRKISESEDEDLNFKLNLDEDETSEWPFATQIETASLKCPLRVTMAPPRLQQAKKTENSSDKISYRCNKQPRSGVPLCSLGFHPVGEFIGNSGSVQKIITRPLLQAKGLKFQPNEDAISRSSECAKSIDLEKSLDSRSSKDFSKEKKGVDKMKKSSSWNNVLNPSYKSMNDNFRRIFKELPENERLLVDYSCALQKENLVYGRLYVSQNYFCFYANIFRCETMLVINCVDVTAMTKEKTARVIPNAIQLCTSSERHFFTSFGARDKTYLMLFRIWQNALTEQPVSIQELLWQCVRYNYGDELGLTSDDDDYVAPSIDDDSKTNGLSFLIGDGSGEFINMDKTPTELSIDSNSDRSSCKNSSDQGSLNQSRSRVHQSSPAEGSPVKKNTLGNFSADTEAEKKVVVLIPGSRKSIVDQDQVKPVASTSASTGNLSGDSTEITNIPRMSDTERVKAVTQRVETNERKQDRESYERNGRIDTVLSIPENAVQRRSYRYLSTLTIIGCQALTFGLIFIIFVFLVIVFFKIKG